MKKLIFFSLALISLRINASVNNMFDTEPGFRRKSIGFNFSPDLCYRTLKDRNGDPTNSYLIESRNNNETIKPGFTTGFNFCYMLNNRVGLETGIQYSKKGYQTVRMKTRLLQPDPEIPDWVKFIYNNHYIDIPLKAIMTFGNGKIRFITSAGITANIYINETVTSVWYFPDRTERRRSDGGYDYNPLNFSAAVSAGIEKQINEKISLRIEPIFRHQLFTITDAPVYGYLFNAGINVAGYWRL